MQFGIRELDEAAWGGDKQAMQKLKSLVTDDTVAIRRMYLPLVTEPSSMHIIIATNDDLAGGG